MLARLNKVGAEPDKVNGNGNGGAIALGHPLGAIGTVSNPAERAGTGQLRHRRRSPLSDRSHPTQGQLH
ncbi:thiolase, C-terminal domain protein [Rhodococcus sp. MTM3W5.2]|nr:thiolase, C-terminal domain protein [Rhodococcus sp. MTM3W5.2]